MSSSNLTLFIALNWNSELKKGKWINEVSSTHGYRNVSLRQWNNVGDVKPVNDS